MKYKDIKTFEDRCNAHPDHQDGVVTDAMILARLHEEIAELRAYIEMQLGKPVAAPVQEPVTLKSLTAKAGVNLPEQYIPTMDEAIAAGDGVLMTEQADLLRECRSALDSLIQKKPQLAGLLCGTTTLGNLKASLYAYRPQGVFGTTPPASQRQWVGLTDEEIAEMWEELKDSISLDHKTWARAIEAKLKEKDT